MPRRPPGPDGPSDLELVRAMARGDVDALAEIFQRHHDAVFRFAHRLTRGESSVEDVAQQTFVLAWSLAGRFRGRSRVTSWLMGIAANVVRRQRRDERRRSSAFALLSTIPQPDVRSPEGEAAQRQLSARLPAAIDRLSHDLRVAYVLCEVEGVPGPEAARVLGLRQGTLWRRLHDARRRLLELLEEP